MMINGTVKCTEQYHYKYPWLEKVYLSDILTKSTYWEVAMRDEFLEHLYTGHGVSEWFEGIPLDVLLQTAKQLAKDFE